MTRYDELPMETQYARKHDDFHPPSTMFNRSKLSADDIKRILKHNRDREIRRPLNWTERIVVLLLAGGSIGIVAFLAWWWFLPDK